MLVRFRLTRSAWNLPTLAAIHICSLGVAAASAQEFQPANMAIKNAKIWTGTNVAGRGGAATDRLEPTAVAIAGARIVAVGSDEEIERHVVAGTRVIDAEGRRVIPGITDSHTHIIGGGFQLDRLNLRDAKNRDEFVRMIGEAAGEKKNAEWLLGGRWSVESWDKPEPPRAAWLDPATGDTPVFLTRMDGHQALVNTAALKLAGIDASGPADPVGGEIERDPKTKEPTGILKESAMDLVSRHAPPVTREQQYAALLRAMKHANSLGITSVQDMSAWDDFLTFHQAANERALTVRITAYATSDRWSDDVQRVIAAAKLFNHPVLTIAGFKGYMDGSLGSRTAYMRKPYADATPEMPYPRGQLSAFADSYSTFLSHVVAADAAELQLAVHAIGDEGNHLLLNAFEEAARRNGSTGPKGPYKRRHRIEHAQHLIPSDIPRFARLGVTASMQPFHKADDGRYAEKAIGRERLKGSYAFRQLVDAGALLVFGSDWPVVTLDPFAGIDSAVNARTLAGEVWLPEHSLTVEEALYAYTVAPAKAIHQEHELGTIEPGKFADIVMLETDPLTIPREKLAEVKPAITIMSGIIVFEARP